ncbi:MAG: hypothetical protein U0930_25300 [Pirellulales bacterium]
MQSQIYLDTARFGQILPECAEMLREFASLLESEGQFPLFNEFLHHGSAAWPQRLANRFPMLTQWQGLSKLKLSVLALCDTTAPASVLFASASRHLARVAFQMLSLRCERVLCSDADWPEFQSMLKKQLAQSSASSYFVTLEDPCSPDSNEDSRLKRMLQAFRDHRCDGALITPVSAQGLTNRVVPFLTQVPNQANIVIDGSQQAGYLPIELGPEFRGIFLAGTHKWLRSGVPLSFGVFVHDSDATQSHRNIRNAIQLSMVDDPMLLQTSEVGITSPRQTMRLEPLIAAHISIQTALKHSIEEMLKIRRLNAHRICDILVNLPLGMSFNCRNGIIELRLESTKISAYEIQRYFAGEGITISVCSDHTLRVSCPAKPLTEAEVDHLWRVFGKLADQYLAAHSLASEGDQSVA